MCSSGNSQLGHFWDCIVQAALEENLKLYIAE